MDIVKLLTKILITFFLIILFNFLEYGFKWNKAEQFIYPIILMIITLIVFYVSKLRKLFLISSLCILLLMIILYLLNELNWANIVGSFGFALLLIVISAYLPQLIKKGFVEKF